MASRDRGREDDRRDDSGRGGGRDGPAFNYRGRSSESVSRRTKQSGGGYDSFVNQEVSWYKPHDGENQIRIMPRAEKDDFEKWGDHWGIDVQVHYGVGPDEGQYLCLDKMLGEPCPVCEARNVAEDDKEKDQLRVNTRILCWVIDRKEEKAGPMLWAMPLGVSKDISAISQVRGSGEPILIDHPSDGSDVFFDKEGVKIHTKYKRFELDRDSTPLHDDAETAQKWLKYINDHSLPGLLEYYPAEQIKKVLYGQAGDPEEREVRADRESHSRRGGDDERESDRGGARTGRVSGRGNTEEVERSPRRGSSRDEPQDELPDRGGGGRRDERSHDNDKNARDSEDRGGGEDREQPRPSRRGEPEREAEPAPASQTQRYRAQADDPAPEPRRGRDEPEEPRSSRRGEPEPDSRDSRRGDGDVESSPKERLQSRFSRRSGR